MISHSGSTKLSDMFVLCWRFEACGVEKEHLKAYICFYLHFHTFQYANVNFVLSFAPLHKIVFEKQNKSSQI